MPLRVLFVHSAFESLGIEYLSACLRQQRIETDLLFDPRLFDDAFVSAPMLARLFERRDALAAAAARLEPDLLAFSVLAANYRWALDMAARIKRLRDVPVVFGGVHASSAPAAVLQNPQADFCIVGEGERGLLGLARALRDNTGLHAVENLCRREAGALRRNRLGPLIQDLDSLPFPDKPLFYERVPGLRRDYTLLTRRGCPNSCSYCHNTVWQRLYPEGPRIRLRSVDNVLQELAQARARWGFERLRINDDLFSYNADWLAEFCRRYRSEINAPFMCSCSPLDLSDAVAAELKRAGCFQVCVGVQDVHEQVRREAFDRHTPQPFVVAALAALRKNRLRATVDNILGFPGQTAEQIKQIAEFYLDNPVYGRFTVFWLIYFAGTTIAERAREQGSLSAADAAALERDPPQQANTLVLRGGLSRSLKRLHLLLLLIQWLPRRLSRWMLARELYRYLPAFNPSLIEGLWTALSADRLDPVRRGYYPKYLYFGARRLLGLSAAPRLRGSGR